MSSTQSDDVVVAYRTGDSLDAHALAAQLASEGINPHVVGDFLTGAYGGVMGSMTQVEIWIPAAQSEQAAPLIERWRGDDASSPTGSKSRFQYSLMTLLVVMTLVAFYAGARPIPESDAQSLAVMIAMNLAIWIAFIYVALRRRRLAKNPRPDYRHPPRRWTDRRSAS